jgi:hypothetical protein
MSYLEKYLKYKNKYLDLLNQIGGAKICYNCKNLIPVDATVCSYCGNSGWKCLICRFQNLSNKEFCANLNPKCGVPRATEAVRQLQGRRPKLVVLTLCTDDSIRARWRNHLMRKFLSMLPQTHDMEVEHLDPTMTIMDIGAYQLAERQLTEDPRLLDCRVIHEFHRSMLTDLARQPCHLFIDMVPTLVYSNMLKQAKDDQGNIYSISSVNIGNVPIYSDELAKCKIFSIQPDGSVVTYIDRMILCGYNFNRQMPYQFIFDLLKHFPGLPHGLVLPILMDVLFEQKLSLKQLIESVKQQIVLLRQ